MKRRRRRWSEGWKRKVRVISHLPLVAWICATSLGVVCKDGCWGVLRSLQGCLLLQLQPTAAISSCSGDQSLLAATTAAELQTSPCRSDPQLKNSSQIYPSLLFSLEFDAPHDVQPYASYRIFPTRAAVKILGLLQSSENYSSF